MTTTFKHIEMVSGCGMLDGREVWIIKNRRGGDSLGTVFWYPTWRQWVVGFEETAVFSEDCLRDVAGFLAELNRNERAKR